VADAFSAADALPLPPFFFFFLALPPFFPNARDLALALGVSR